MTFKYSDNNKMYHTLDYFYKHKFHSKIAKISLNGGFTCPNKDGTKGVGGCIYCSKSGSGEYAGNPQKSIIEQFYEVKNVMDRKWKNTKYIAYFQANTNTYAPINILDKLYHEALKITDVVGLNIATRADAISDDCLELLENISKETYLTIELGLQTIHKKTSNLINRGHDLQCFSDMVHQLRERNINVVVHIINGLPYETKDMMLETTKFVNSLDIQGIKIHMLSVLKDTKLAEMYQEKPFSILSKDEYIDIVCDELSLLRPEIVINRLTGDPDIHELITPTWLIKKFIVLNDIDKEMKKRSIYQGSMLKK